MSLRNKSIESFLLYAIAFMLIWEWLRPLRVVGEVFNLHIFILFLALSFLLAFLQVNKLAAFLVSTGFIILAINHTFYNVPFIAIIWPAEFAKDIFINLGHILKWDFIAITDAFRTLLLFILLWLLVYLLHYWMIIRKKLMFFFLLTVLYLTVIDTFFPYDAKFAIFRTVIFGFLGLGILNFYHLIEKEQLYVSNILKKRWLWSLIVMLIFSGTVGIMIPKAGPKWPDPIPYIQSYANHHWGNGLGKGAIQKIGYDENDSYLGGPFIGDDTVVFHAFSPRREYWRVETKDVYTGKGWELSFENSSEEIEGSDGSIPIYSVEAAYKEEEDTVHIQTIEPVNHVIYPHGVNRITFTGAEEESFTYNRVNEKINTSFNINSYTAEYEKPRFEIFSLREVTSSHGLPAEFIAHYTQLPEELPERIAELASDITEGADNWYDKAKAIEGYLQGPNFTYDTQNVAIPGAEDDYVDQFLFDTMSGYCDNFSSSMVIMLRSLDIPARWVKGYAPGEVLETSSDGSMYEITNNEAHSWVEAFFPGIGWVPFEPTKGFDSPADFYFDLSKREPTEREPEDRDTPPEVNRPEEPEAPEQNNDNKKPSSTNESFAWNQFFINALIWLAWGAGAVLLISIVLFFTRKKWYPYWLFVKYKNNNDETSYEKAYLDLLRQLKWLGFVKKEEETLRSFAEYIDTFFDTKDMTDLTAQYERVIYRNDKNQNIWDDSLKMKWKDLLLRLIGKTS